MTWKYKVTFHFGDNHSATIQMDDYEWIFPALENRWLTVKGNPITIIQVYEIRTIEITKLDQE